MILEVGKTVRTLFIFVFSISLSMNVYFGEKI